MRLSIPSENNLAGLAAWTMWCKSGSFACALLLVGSRWDFLMVWYLDGAGVVGQAPGLLCFIGRSNYIENSQARLHASTLQTDAAALLVRCVLSVHCGTFCMCGPRAGAGGVGRALGLAVWTAWSTYRFGFGCASKWSAWVYAWVSATAYFLK